MLRRYRRSRPRVEGGFSGFLPWLDRDDSSALDLGDLDRGQPDAARSDDDDEVLFVRLTEGHDGPVRGRAATSERGRKGDVKTRRHREHGPLLGDDEFGVAAGQIETKGVSFLTE